MKIEIHHYHHYGNIHGTINQIQEMLIRILRKEVEILAKFDQLKKEVAEMKGVVASAITVFHGLAAKVEENKEDPVELQNIVDDLKASATSLAEAIATEPAAAPADQAAEQKPEDSEKAAQE